MNQKNVAAAETTFGVLEPKFLTVALCQALVFHFNHGSASIAATVAYICTVLVVILTAKTIDVDERLNDLYFLCHLGTGVCIATYWPLGRQRIIKAQS